VVTTKKTAKTPKKTTGSKSAPKSRSTKRVVGDGGKGKANGKGAPAGNQFWKARSKHGKDKIFQTPENLFNACCEYFEWAEKNPLVRERYAAGKGRTRVIKEKTPRPFTLISLTSFLGINKSTWIKNYRTHKDYIHVTSWAEDMIRDQKLMGAAAGHFNANIIARDLGMADTQRLGNVEGEVLETAHDTAGAASDVLERITKDMSDKEAARIYKAFTSTRRAHTGHEQT
jgi:hypothetical protein